MGHVVYTDYFYNNNNKFLEDIVCAFVCLLTNIENYVY